MATFFGNNPTKYHCDDSCKSYREENKKKDDLIQQLCKIHPANSIEVTHLKPFHNGLQNEVPALQVKIDTLEEKLRHKQSEIDSKNEKIAIHKKEAEIHRLEAEKFDNDNRKLMSANRELQSSVDAYESLKYRSEYTIKCLQEQLRESQMKVADAEARIRTHVMDKEKTDHVKSNIESRFQNFLINVSRLVSVTDFHETDKILKKLTEIAEQNAHMNGKIHSLEHKVSETEKEANDARETIVKLMKDYEGVGHGREDLKETKGRLEAESTDMKAQIKLLTHRIETLQKLYDTSKTTIEDKTNQIINTEVKLKEQQYATVSAGTMLSSLMESLAALLGTPFTPCPVNEAAIKERVKNMVEKLKEQTSAAETLDQRVLMLQKQFESQYETGKELMGRASTSDSMKQELLHKIKVLEDDIAAQQILRDNLKCENERVFKHVNKLADLLQIDYLPSDRDTIGLVDLLIERCQELMINRNAWSCQRCSAMKTQIPDSQKQAKRITALKEELEAKDLQIQLLEKRQGQHGYKAESGRLGDETNRDRVHRLHHQLEESQIEIEELRRALVRSQSADFEIHKQQKHQQQEEIEQLTLTIEKLDKTRQKQAKKISVMKTQIENKEHKLSHQIKASDDLKEARQLLEEIRRREIQLLQFRASVAAAVGVDIRCSHDPDCEIEARIQSLLSMAQNAVSTPFTPYYLSQNLGPHFQQGYSNPSIASNGSSPTTLPVRNPTVSFDDSSQRLSKRSQIPKNKIMFSTGPTKHNRTRSTSPTKRDERKY